MWIFGFHSVFPVKIQCFRFGVLFRAPESPCAAGKGIGPARPVVNGRRVTAKRPPPLKVKAEEPLGPPRASPGSLKIPDTAHTTAIRFNGLAITRTGAEELQAPCADNRLLAVLGTRPVVVLLEGSYSDQ